MNPTILKSRCLFSRFFLLWIFSVMPGLPVIGQTIYAVTTVPDPKALDGGYVSDPDDYLGWSEEARLNELIQAIEDSVSAQVAVVMLGSIGEENPKDFATRLFNHWGIGSAASDNGLLILSVVDQRRTEFETGYSMEAVLPDIYCYRIGMQVLVPYFREGAYGEGLIATVSAIKGILEDPSSLDDLRAGTEARGGQKVRDPALWYGIPAILRWYILINLLVHLLLLVWGLKVNYSKEELYDKYHQVRKVTTLFLILLFPVPYGFVYWYFRKWMKRLREQTRYSKVNGKRMVRLDEQADDAYLEKGQLTEEEIGSVDYDVWVTEDLDDIRILRYKAPFNKYSICPECEYLTYSLSRSRVVERATYTHSGKRAETYLCKNCGYTHTKLVTIPKKQRSSSSGGGGWSSSSGGGGSWGGGSSGGGGAGVGW